MPYLINAADRAAFKRCRRQWDFSATARHRLSPLGAAKPDLDRAVRDALAVYYFPGMWDWNSAIVLPLVVKAFDDAIARQCESAGNAPDGDDDARWQVLLDQGHLLLERYFAWAPTVDRFSPVRVETDFETIVPDPSGPDRYVLAPDGAEVLYTGRIDLLAIDEYDRYWVVRHRVTDESFPSTEQLVLEEESVAACWAWGLFYDGMEVAGTIYNEVSSPDPDTAASGRALSMPVAEHMRGGLLQHDGSGGGRGVSSPRRMYVKGRPAEKVERIRQSEDDGLRRTTIRRTEAEVRAAGTKVAQEALDMVSSDVPTYPNPVPSHCAVCRFAKPCLALHEDRDVEPILGAAYRQRPAVEIEIGRLGGSPYGVGRGWVPGFPGHEHE